MNALRAIGRLRPDQIATCCVHAPHAGLKSPRANHITIAADTPDQVDQPLNIVHAARRSNGRLPADAAAGWVQASQTPAQTHHQRVTHRQHDARLPEHQRLVGPQLRPQLAAGLPVIGTHSAVRSQDKYPSTCNKWCRVSLRGQFLTPNLTSNKKGHCLVGLGDHGRRFSVSAYARGDRCTCVGTPDVCTRAAVDRNQ